MSTPSGHDSDPELGWGVGSVAARLGIAASTLRTWERRYDVGPSRRTAGGHRRYTEVDIERVMLTQLLIARGAPPSDAARVAHALDDADLTQALSSEHGQTERESGPPEEVVKAVLDAATTDDPRRIGRLVADALHGLGAIGAWTDVVAPTLITIGEEWSAGRLGIEAEHLASEAIAGELRAHTRRLAIDEQAGPTIILASAEDDQHSLPILALDAALAEAGVAAHVLGARLPAPALADASARLRPRAIFLWASLPRPEDDPLWEVLAGIGVGTTVVLGGPGWPAGVGRARGPVGTVEAADLRSTVDHLLEADGSGTRPAEARPSVP